MRCGSLCPDWDSGSGDGCIDKCPVEGFAECSKRCAEREKGDKQSVRNDIASMRKELETGRHAEAQARDAIRTAQERLAASLQKIEEAEGTLRQRCSRAADLGMLSSFRPYDTSNLTFPRPAYVHSDAAHVRELTEHYKLPGDQSEEWTAAKEAAVGRIVVVIGEARPGGGGAGQETDWGQSAPSRGAAEQQVGTTTTRAEGDEFDLSAREEDVAVETPPPTPPPTPVPPTPAPTSTGVLRVRFNGVTYTFPHQTLVDMNGSSVEYCVANGLK